MGVQKQNWLSTDRLLYPLGSNVRHFFGKGLAVAIKQLEAYAGKNLNKIKHAAYGRAGKST